MEIIRTSLSPGVIKPAKITDRTPTQGTKRKRHRAHRQPHHN